MAVVDIGGRTTDIAVILTDEQGVPVGIDRERSGSEEFGVLQVRDTLASLLSRELRLDRIDDRTLDTVFRLGKAKIYGKMQDFGGLVQEASAKIRMEIANAVRHRLGDGTSLQAVWVVGGGAHKIDLRGVLPPEWNVVVADDPEFANVTGMFLRARDVLLRQGYHLVSPVGDSDRETPVVSAGEV